MHGDGSHALDGLLDQAERRTDQQRIHGTQQKSPEHTQGTSNLMGQHHQQREHDDGENHEPSANQGAPGCVKRLSIELERRIEYGQHGSVNAGSRTERSGS